MVWLSGFIHRSRDETDEDDLQGLRRFSHVKKIKPNRFSWAKSPLFSIGRFFDVAKKKEIGRHRAYSSNCRKQEVCDPALTAFSPLLQSIEEIINLIIYLL